MPALSASDHALKVFVLPVKKLRWSEVNDVRIEDGKLLIAIEGGKSRKINLALLGDCDAAVAAMRKTLTKQQGIERDSTEA